MAEDNKSKDRVETPKPKNSVAALKKFFTPEGGMKMSIAEFTAEWNELSEEEKLWFKAQTLE